MPSPKELAALKKWADNSDDLYFVVNEVVDCETSSEEEEQDESLIRDKELAKDKARREKLVGKGFVCSKVVGSGNYKEDVYDSDNDDNDDERRRNEKKELEDRDISKHLANAKINNKEIETNSFCSNSKADVEGGASGDGDTIKDEYNVD